MTDKSIAVSEIRQWILCPRQLYFKTGASEKEQKAEEKETVKLKKEIQRELLYELPEIIQNSISKNQDDFFIDNRKLRRQIEETIKEIAAENEERIEQKMEERIEERIEEKIEEKIEKQFQWISEDEIERIIENIHKTIERSGFSLYDAAADPFKIEPLVYSEKPDIYGRPSKILNCGEKLLPYIIRTSKAPQNGVWESDRVTAAAYFMIIEKEYGYRQISKYSIIDYFGDYRIFQVNSVDKRKVFRAIRKIKEIKKGKMPAERNIFLCKTCRYHEKCRPKMKTIFSKLFEKTGFK